MLVPQNQVISTSPKHSHLSKWPHILLGKARRKTHCEDPRSADLTSSIFKQLWSCELAQGWDWLRAVTLYCGDSSSISTSQT